MPETAIVQPYEIGKFYLVPVAYVKEDMPTPKGFGPRSPVPLMGDVHEDKEIIGFPHAHYHIDWRFARNVAFTEATEYLEQHLEYAVVINDEFIDRIELKRLKCRRDPREYPSHVPHWFPKLEQRFAHAIAKNGRCPHQGYDMTTLKPDENGCVTCPLHGLKWNAQSWKMELQGINV